MLTKKQAFDKYGEAAVRALVVELNRSPNDERKVIYMQERFGRDGVALIAIAGELDEPQTASEAWSELCATLAYSARSDLAAVRRFFGRILKLVRHDG